MADPNTHDRSAVHVLVAVLAALAIVALLAYARGEPGVDGRAPDPEDAAALVTLSSRAG